MHQNCFQNLICLLKKQFYEEICQRYKNNSKIISQHLNKLLGRCSVNSSCTENLNINSVCEFFANLCQSTVANLPAQKKLHP